LPSNIAGFKAIRGKTLTLNDGTEFDDALTKPRYLLKFC
jgi:hypothetical protein